MNTFPSYAATPGSRYVPQTVSRIIDITDLVDNASDSSDDEEIIGHSATGGTMLNMTQNKAYGPGGVGSRSFVAKQICILFILLGVIVGSCVAIGYAVLDVDNEDSQVGQQLQMENQQLLETAERVITACSESRLNQDLGECQDLCHSRMCCFESGKYNCEKDEKKACAVFAGCEALVDGALFYNDEIEGDV